MSSGGPAGAKVLKSLTSRSCGRFSKPRRSRGCNGYKNLDKKSMRIIGGERRKKKLISVPGLDTRPTSDRVKETLFNIIQSRVRGASVLDLFAGTGALGLEALSRGALHCTFVDNARGALAVCEKNIEACGYKEKASTLFWNIEKSLARVEAPKDGFHLIFIDPPYRKGLATKALRHISSQNFCAREGLVVVEHAAGDPPEVPDGLRFNETRSYGTTALSFLSWA